MDCTNIILPKFRQEPFIGCDGKPWDVDFLKYHIELAIEDERYEFAMECKNEINRREALNLKS